MKIFDWSEINNKRSKGVEKTTCPNCSHERKNKKDPCLYVNHNSGVAKCFNCESLSFKEDNKKDYTKKQYTEISQELNTDVLSDEKALKYISSRKIDKSTLKRMYVSFERHYQPSLGREVQNIVFNYYEGSKLVNKKYRSADKKFTQIKGGKPIFYNINSVIGQEEVYIVEGEFDVLAMVQHGISNVISVPNGANDNDEYWENSKTHLEDVKRFIIAVDNDEKGNILKDKIAQRLGRYRCDFIEWRNKDANGDLIEGCIEESLSNRKKFPISGTWNISDLKQGILDLHKNGLPKTIKPKDKSFGNLGDIFSIMKGQLTVVTGIPSHGKSNFTEWYLLNLIKDYDLKSSIFSPEHTPMELHQTVLIQKVIGRNFWKDYPSRPRINEQDINRYINWAKEKIYITLPNEGDSPTWDWILETFKEQMFNFGIDIFVVDAFNKVTGAKTKEEKDEVITRLTSFCQVNNVAILLIAHPTKMTKQEDGTYNIPTLYDVSGTADFRNQTHNGFAIHRVFERDGQEGHTKFINLKTKFSFQGEIGKDMAFYYDDCSGRYYAMGELLNTNDLTISDNKQQSIMNNDNFDNESKVFDYSGDGDAPF